MSQVIPGPKPANGVCWKRAILIAIGLPAAVACVLVTLAWLFMATSSGPTWDRPNHYPATRGTMVAIHGPLADFLPPSLPIAATDVRIKGSGCDVMQAEPFVTVQFNLPSPEAEAEIARLRALNPLTERPAPEPPRLIQANETILSKQPKAFFLVLTDPASSRTEAWTWIDPDTGRFVYHLSAD